MIHKAKKSLGQNFLKSVSALNKIVEAGELSELDTVLEIGPGKGVLTEKLLKKAGCVVAVETDRNLFVFLQEKFRNEIKIKKLILVENDILEFDIKDLKEKYKVIANIPYNITGLILKKFLTAENQPKMMILMIQNEVAKRIVARDGKESILSISVKAYGDPKIITKVPARYFSPAPEVDSAVISIKNISKNIFIENKMEEKQFWEIVHAGFAHKRKKLSSNLKKYIKNERLASVLNLGNKRAEELSVSDWINLLKDININKKE